MERHGSTGDIVVCKGVLLGRGDDLGDISFPSGDTTPESVNSPTPIEIAAPSAIKATDRTVESRRNQELMRSVVKILVDSISYDYSQPWRICEPSRSYGSGFVIAGNRIMTNAHVVADNCRVLARKLGDPKKYQAKVLAVSHECDLALLTIDDDKFFDGVPPLSFGGIPDLRDSVVVVGFPKGGDNVSITAGVVSRLEAIEYSHSEATLLCAQVDAAINPGNSGGPAFRLPDCNVVGVAFQAMKSAAGISHIIPTSVVKKFLDDVDRGSDSMGFVRLGVRWQPMENPTLKKVLGVEAIDASLLPVGVTNAGVLVTEVDVLNHGAPQLADSQNDDNTSKAEPSGLAAGDVLLAIDDVDVADDGTIDFRGITRLPLEEVCSLKFSGDRSKAVVLRNGRVININVTLRRPNILMPRFIYDTPPKYFIFGGLIFTPLTRALVRAEGGSNLLYAHLARDFKSYEDEEIVTLLKVLPSDLTLGYENITMARVTKVNGLDIRNLKHFVDIMEAPEKLPRASCLPPRGGDAESSEEPLYLELELECRKKVILNYHEAKEQTAAIMKKNAVPSDRSACL